LLINSRKPSPRLASSEYTASWATACAIYTFIFAFGVFYIYRLLRAGPVGHLVLPPSPAVPNRPLSVVDPDTAGVLHVGVGE
jgi:cytochrome bd ubiquinol oxidase subunit I